MRAPIRAAAATLLAALVLAGCGRKPATQEAGGTSAAVGTKPDGSEPSSTSTV